MNINFAMWRTALSTLVKMDKKEEWDKLDVVSKWLIGTRSAVTIVTLYSCAIGGLLALRDKHFTFLPWLIVTIGLFLAHGANNFLNDYTDFSRGIDQGNYFRTQYGVHPLVQEFWTKRQQLTWFLVSGILAFAAGIFALWYTNFAPIVIGLFAFGAVVLLFYTYPIKYIALGELCIFLIWGPILVAGVYTVLARGWTSDFWNVALAGVPFGLSVVSINMGKHIDKTPQDRKNGVHTLPVAIGEKAARYINMGVMVLMYLLIFYLIFVTRYFTPVLLIVLFAGRRWLYATLVLLKPRPEEPPKEWPGWPVWFSGFAFYHNRLFSNLLLLGLVADTLLRLFAGSFWPMK